MIHTLRAGGTFPLSCKAHFRSMIPKAGYGYVNNCWPGGEDLWSQTATLWGKSSTTAWERRTVKLISLLKHESMPHLIIRHDLTTFRCDLLFLTSRRCRPDCQFKDPPSRNNNAIKQKTSVCVWASLQYKELQMVCTGRQDLDIGLSYTARMTYSKTAH